MELDKPKKPESSSEHKEQKKSTTKRVPAHVPLPIEERKKVSLEKKPKSEKVSLKKKKKEIQPPQEDAPKHKEILKPEETPHERPKVSLEKQPKPSDEHEKKVAERTEAQKPQSEFAPAEKKHEEVVPLHVETEGEVFISERLRQPHESEGAEPQELTEQPSTDSAEQVKADEQIAEDESTDSTPSPQRQMRQNPQQQQQTGGANSSASRASAASAAAASGAAASPFLAQWRNRNAGGGGNVPPRTPNTSPNGGGNMPPVPPFNPNMVPGNPNFQPANHNALPLTSQPAPEIVRDRASERRHLVTGLVVGALVEHIRHKRREKRMTKAHKKEVAGLKKTQDATNFEKKLADDTHLREKTALEKTIERMKKQPAKEVMAVPVPLTAEKAPSVTATMQNKTEKPPTVTEKPKTAEEARKEMEERARRAVEELHAETLAVPEGHHIEQSSWHAIEVDNKTGKAVENSAITYGKAFEQERHQEQLHQSQHDDEKSDAKHEQGSPLTAMAFPHPAEKSKKSESGKDGNTANQTKSERAAELARVAASRVGQIQPIDALLWVILGLVVLIILKLL